MMIRRWRLFMILLAALLLGAGCSPARQPEPQGNKPNYNEIKSMVVDILHTKDGTETIKQIIKEPDVRKDLAVNPAEIQGAVQETVTKNQNFLLDQMKDPKFAEILVKASKQQNQQILKETLMKDPEYQQQLIQLMKTPDFQKSMIALMESPEYRKETMKIMQEALQNPEFKMTFMDTVREAIQSSGKQDAKKNPEKNKGKKDEEGDQNTDKKQEGE
jgi:spore germination protein D